MWMEMVWAESGLQAAVVLATMISAGLLAFAERRFAAVLLLGSIGLGAVVGGWVAGHFREPGKLRGTIQILCLTFRRYRYTRLIVVLDRNCTCRTDGYVRSICLTWN